MNDIELQGELNKANAALGGLCSAIHGYMDNVGVPKINKANRRVKLLTLLYQSALIENCRLKLLLEDGASEA